MSDSGTVAIPEDVFQSFFPGEKVQAEPLGRGNINDTYLVSGLRRKVVLQKICAAVFPDPAGVAANFQVVSSHLVNKSKEAPFLYRCAALVQTRSGQGWYLDAQGGCWRAQSYVEHVRFSGKQLNSGRARELGRVLARFHQLTDDLDTAGLCEPIPGFHRTHRYLETFDAALMDSVPPDTAGLDECLSMVERYRHRAVVLEQARAAGVLPVRVMHGDPKLDNVIWTAGGKATGLFDLDTVGPGLRLYDLGDCLRSCCNAAGEEGGQQQVEFAAGVYRDVLQGYFRGGEQVLIDAEKELIMDAVLAITVELGVRFLTDYLRGDVYFKTTRPGQNLSRALVQFRLADSLASQEKELRGMWG